MMTKSDNSSAKSGNLSRPDGVSKASLLECKPSDVSLTEQHVKASSRNNVATAKVFKVSDCQKNF